MVEHEPSVERLEFHYEGHHTVYYKEFEHENAKNWGKKNLRSLLHTLPLIISIKTQKAFSMLTFRNILLGIKQKGYGNPEQYTKSEVSQLKL